MAETGDERIFKIIIFPGRSGRQFSAHRKRHDRSDRTTHLAPVEWAGVVHRNTDHPHAHLIVRGSSVRRSTETPTHAHPEGPSRSCPDVLTQQLGPRTMEDIQRQKQIELTPIELHPWIGELADAQSFIPTTMGTVTPASQTTPVSWLAFDT